MLPNFLIVGAHKAATTSLHRYAGEHPDVFMSAHKETRFFVSDYFRAIPTDYEHHAALMKVVVFSRETYEACFADADGAAIRGEASPQYLYLYRMAIPNILETLDQPKIAIVLRDPVDRAHSAYRMLVRLGVYHDSLERLIDTESTFIERNWPPSFHVLRTGFYADQVHAYRTAFRDVRIMLHDDLERDPHTFMGGFFDWLGVDPSFVPDVGRRHHVGENIVDLSPETRARLRTLYRDDIRRLQDDLDLDLSAWLD